ncbi:MAG: archease [Gammaproteobacteria bacterium]|nr:archease [Gammaproteobacteria bacterium]NIR83757.1 archease [Gammaproteobacteria bacterium]NIU05063.1 archease [Gammaproteobacteria bacterium]NIX86336.1 archease [Gammaproteobacteria bacterium]
MPYEYLDEIATADVAFRAAGRDLSELFAAAADATMNVMVDDLETVRPYRQLELRLENERLDMLLFDLLQELIYYKDAEQLLLRVRAVQIDQADGAYRLRGQAAGERLDPARHAQGADIKAVTLHQFRVYQDAGRWFAQVILDI